MTHALATRSYTRVLPSGVAGRGAWQDWRYEVEVTHNATSSNRTYKMAKLHLRVSNLTPGNLYRFCVRATSSSGRGPWSQSFIGETLKAGSYSSERNFEKNADVSTRFYEPLSRIGGLAAHVINVCVCDQGPKKRVETPAFVLQNLKLV